MCSLFSFSFHKVRHQQKSSHQNRYICATLEYSDPRGKETLCVVDFDLMHVGLLKLFQLFAMVRHIVLIIHCVLRHDFHMLQRISKIIHRHLRRYCFLVAIVWKA